MPILQKYILSILRKSFKYIEVELNTSIRQAWVSAERQHEVSRNNTETNQQKVVRN